MYECFNHPIPATRTPPPPSPHPQAVVYTTERSKTVVPV